MPVPDLDKLLGIEVYATKTMGVGGAIRESVDDFVVEEVLVDGSKAAVNGEVPKRVLGSALQKQRFLLCVLVKRNWDTFIAVKNIAKSLGIDQARVQFAGIKDAKAITAQHISIENVSMEEVGKVDVKDVEVRPVGYVREMLSLFYLLGNNFTITIKSITDSEATVKENIAQTMKELEAIGGIPNFFGHQRFGTTRPITHLVGKALVRGDFEEAAMLFLAKPSVHEHPASRQARQDLQSTGDFKQAQENFPKQLRFERLLLNHLADNPGDFVGAFQRLPVKLQALFVQAHQSYLFNRFLSERVKHGLPLNEAVEGDYVVGVERSGLPLTTVAKIATVENLAEVNAQIKAGRLRVALPIFGVKQKLSQGIMGQLENEVLEQEGVEADNLRFNVLSRTGGKGGLRTAVTPIKDFKLQSVSANQDGSELQATVSFMLLRGSYATVVLREIIKPSDPIAAGF
ncbi:MAG: tRNA pseudouridine(13) synthase TruD [Candidatus Bathyarchaeota archaeon]|nr:tRNA pseudouridine(13) synthase TruD [Candidatus Bathyarchaeota archaeon]